MNEVRALLRQQFSLSCDPSQIEPLGNAGGMSGAQFWRVESPQGPLVLRRWPPEQPTPDRLGFIHDVLRHAISRGVEFVPILITTRGGESFFSHGGHLWELAPCMPGEADFERSPTPEKLRAAMTALARFHIAVADFRSSKKAGGSSDAVPSETAIPRRLARLRALSPAEIDKLSKAIDETHWPGLALLARQFISHLPSAIPPAIAQLEPLTDVQFSLQPCLRDIWHDHVLFTGDRVTGIIDFGALDIDTPATDIARLLGSLIRDPIAAADTWQTALADYNATRQLSQQELKAVSAIHAANPILAGVNWIRWIYVDHRAFEHPAQILTRFGTLVTRLKQVIADGR